MRDSGKQLALVALPLALRRTLTYGIPPELAPSLSIGHRVRVPLGTRRTHGYIVGFTREFPPGPLRQIVSLEPPEALFSPEILRLAQWVSEYYLCPLGQVLDAALPPSVRRNTGKRPPRPAAGDPALLPADSLREALDLEASLMEADRLGATLTLQGEQQAAADAILGALREKRFVAFLLHGVTGSGKTEVYLRAAEEVLEQGGGVLYLVPEIALGTQVLSRVSRRFPGKVGIYHSLAGEAARRNAWRDARSGRLPMVVGTRSAVFVPIPNLRLVVIDEEQEGAFKQEESPRYHGRDVAVVRARQAGAVVVLGTATPSMESLYNLEQGKYRLLRLSLRVDSRPLARVVVVDLAEGHRQVPGARGGRQARPSAPRIVLSNVLLRAMQDRLDRGEQSILFLNRRGYSTIVQCADCGQPVHCKQCDVAMTYHKGAGLLRCHYCNAILREVTECAACRGVRFLYLGMGTQKIEEIVREVFPAARIARMDFDTTRRKGSHLDLVQAMESGEVDILLGTQMVAKGFHFPRVTLVGVVQADREMLQPDFRAAERAFQILTQVAGRAGRGSTPGEVILQSLLPDHHVIACAATGDYLNFAERELQFRRNLEYPPYARMIDLLVDGARNEQVEKRAEALKAFLDGKLLEEELTRGRQAVEVLGPAPMPLSRLKGRYRWHLTLKGGSAKTLHQAAGWALQEAAPKGLSGTRLQIDVDPLSLA